MPVRTRPVPAPVRAAGFVGALLLFAFLAPSAAALVDDRPLVAAANIAVLVLFLPPLIWVGVAPEGLASIVWRRWRIDLGDPRQAFGVGIQYVFVTLMFGVLTLVGTANSYAVVQETGEQTAAPLPEALLVATLLLTLALFAVATFSWLMLVKRLDLAGCIHALGLDARLVPRGVLWGVAAAFGILMASGAIGLAAQELGVETDNPQAEAIAGSLTPLGAGVVGLLAGLGEELYFRGLLLPRIGNFAQAALFGVVHMGYLTPLQVALPFIFGFVFGWLRRGAGLWAAIIAHALFDLVALLGLAYLDEASSMALAAFVGSHAVP